MIFPAAGFKGVNEDSFITLNINGKAVQVTADPAMPLLWLLRDVLDMTGTKFGCGVAAWGACTVRVDGVAVRFCRARHAIWQCLNWLRPRRDGVSLGRLAVRWAWRCMSHLAPSWRSKWRERLYLP